jgi:Cys-rich repeat protein
MKNFAIILGTICTLGLVACVQPDPGPTPAINDPITIQLSNQDGDLQYCDDSGECTTLPYDGDCAIIEIDIDPATGATCERCITADGQAIDLGCANTSVGCVLVTLPDPDCVVCAYINGAIIYSTCTADEEPECYTDSDCISDDGIGGFCIDGQCVFEPGCLEDADCPAGFMCAFPDYGFPNEGGGSDPSPPQPPPDDWYGTCVPRDIGCTSDAECPGDMYCEMWCYEDQPTEPAFACGANADCPPGHACFDGMCICDSATGIDCMPPPPPPCEGICQPHHQNPCENVVCPTGMHCEAFDVYCFAPPCQPVAECVPDQRECIEDSDCPMGFACSIEVCPAMPCTPDYCPPCYGVCEPVEPEYCYSNEDCASDEICEFYEGVPCDQDGTCADPGLWAPGVCVPAPFVCETNEDCLSSAGELAYCVNGTCVFEFDCDQNHAFCDMIPPICPDGQVITVVNGCFGPCVDPGLCEPASQECFANTDCPPMHECLMYCWDCAPGDPTCIGGCEGVCVPFEPMCYSDQDCWDAAGNVGRCEGGMCVFEELYCWEDSECPGDMVCDQMCGGGGSPGTDPCDPDDPNCSGFAPCYGVCVPAPSDECFRTGCSGEICADQDMASACIWLDEFMCLDSAICERQDNGVCGWTMTEEANICMEDLGTTP